MQLNLNMRPGNDGLSSPRFVKTHPAFIVTPYGASSQIVIPAQAGIQGQRRRLIVGDYRHSSAGGNQGSTILRLLDICQPWCDFLHWDFLCPSKESPLKKRLDAPCSARWPAGHRWLRRAGANSDYKAVLKHVRPLFPPSLRCAQKGAGECVTVLRCGGRLGFKL